MTRFALRLAVIVAAGFPLAAEQPGPAFDVASIKRNNGPMPRTSGTLHNTPKGEIRLVWIPARLLVLLAYPVDVTPAEVIGLPSWANSDRYDVTVKGSPDATPEQVTQMWRTLLTDRMQLAAHYEPRNVRGYKLVVARSDGKLGPELKPSTLDWAAAEAKPTGVPPPAAMRALRPGSVVTPQTERLLMSQCRATMRVGSTTYAGGIDMNGLAWDLRLVLREPIENHTALEGLYSFKLTFSQQPLSPQAVDNNTPSIFTALEEQLGLKLEPATLRSPAVVVEHIERPTPD